MFYEYLGSDAYQHQSAEQLHAQVEAFSAEHSDEAPGKRDDE